MWMHYKDRFTFGRHDVSRTELWRLITFTYQSRNIVLMQPVINNPTPGNSCGTLSTLTIFFCCLKNVPVHNCCVCLCCYSTRPHYLATAFQPGIHLVLDLTDFTLCSFDSIRPSKTKFSSIVYTLHACLTAVLATRSFRSSSIC